MNHLIFEHDYRATYDIAILVPRLSKSEIEKHYLEPYIQDKSKVIAFSLLQSGKKTPQKIQKEYLEQLLPELIRLQVKYIMVCDSDYFKTMVKVPKTEAHLGYIMQLREDLIGSGFPADIIYCPNYSGIFYDPEKTRAKIGQAFLALLSHMDKNYIAPGSSIIKFEEYPTTVEDISIWLQKLLDMDCDFTCDIEAFSLKHYNAGIGTISFAWNKHEGIAFPVDLSAEPEKVRTLLKQFFIAFKRKMTYHRINYDVYVLIYQLFMNDILDTEGLLEGLSIMMKNWDDTRIIAYLATNSCAGNDNALKSLAQEFAGNYAVEDIKDIRIIPLDKLLRYNLVDGLSTWYVKDKFYDTMVADQQLDIYENIFKPAMLDIIQMQLTGLPINIKKVAKARAELETAQADALDRMMNLKIVKDFVDRRNYEWVIKRNEELKVKRVTLSDANETFNPNSDKQKQQLLFEIMGLPILDLTDSKQPATGGKTLKKLKFHTTDPEALILLDALIDFADVDVIITNFIPAFENARLGPDGWHYLFGYFNLGGTLSGRLSSSDPNLQNIPAHSRYSKIIKECIEAPPGWLFCAIDFNALEDRISALTTKDPNKLKIYTDGFDGHCLRALAYFEDQLPKLDPNNVQEVNSIEKTHPQLRQKGKNPTFALTYQGTIETLMRNYGFTRELATKVYNAYNDLYSISVSWVNAKLAQASKDGYITAAFGLRVRTPLLKQVVMGSKKTPYEALAEGRSAGNALGQSWCLLNSRAGSEFMAKVRDSEFRLDIRPCAQIHDAGYHLVRDGMKVFQYYNEHFVKAVQWQDHPDIYHDEVKLGGTASIYYPNWANEMKVENYATETDILAARQKHLTKLKEKGLL